MYALLGRAKAIRASVKLTYKPVASSLCVEVFKPTSAEKPEHFDFEFPPELSIITKKTRGIRGVEQKFFTHAKFGKMAVNKATYALHSGAQETLISLLKKNGFSHSVEHTPRANLEMHHFELYRG